MQASWPAARPALPTEALAQAASVLARVPNVEPRLLANAVQALWERVNTLSRNGQPVYAGLVGTGGSSLIFPSEARALAEVLRTTVAVTPEDPRVPVLRAGLLGLATGEGWGATDATASALAALGASWAVPPRPTVASITLGTLSPGERPVTGTLDRDRPVLSARSTRPGPGRVQGPAGAAVLAGADFVPAEPGATARAVQNGLVLTRTLYRVPATGPMVLLEPDGGAIRLYAGDVVEEVAELATPEDRAHLSLRLPLPAGLEPLNPNLATATADAAPSAPPTITPAWSAYADDEVRHVWLTLPRGTVTVRHRMRAQVPGTFTHPPAAAELLYLPGVDGFSAGQRVVVAR